MPSCVSVPVGKFIPAFSRSPYFASPIKENGPPESDPFLNVLPSLVAKEQDLGPQRSAGCFFNSRDNVFADRINFFFGQCCLGRL